MDSSSTSRQTPMSILHALATSAAPLIEDPRAPLAERLRALIIKAEATAGAANLAPQPPLQTARTAKAPNHGRHFPKSTSEPGVSAGAISGTTSSDWGSHVHNVECDTSGRLTAGIGGLFKSFPSFPGATLNASPSAAAISHQDVLINGSGSSCGIPRSPRSPRSSASPRSPHSPRSPARQRCSFASRLAARGPSASQKVPPPSVAHLIPERVQSAQPVPDSGTLLTDNPTGNQTCNTATDRHGSQERLWGKRLFLHHSRLSAPANLQIPAVDLTSPEPGSEGPTGSSGGSSVSGERKRKALPGVCLSAGDLSAEAMEEDVTSAAAYNAAVILNKGAAYSGAATSEAAHNETAGAVDKKPRRGAETVLVCAQQVIEEPKLVVELRSNMELLDDGYRWRKYGQKVVRDPCVVVTSYEGRHCHAMPGPVFSPPPAERNSPVAAGGDSGTLSTAAGSRNDNPGMCSFRLPGEAVAVNGVGYWVLH
ncbi:unnamed protein product [Closterium sp. NIES-65]|nr:unnamed protein product [Closterium sp. NIES-65]